MNSVEQDCERIVVLVRSDLEEARRLAATLRERWAEYGGVRERALVRRAGAIVDWASNQYDSALAGFRESLRLFEEAGETVEAARTRSNAIQTLIYLSQYEEAMRWAEQARRVFLEAGEELRLARLDGNVANLLYRQDRFEEAILLYEDVAARFLRSGEVRDVAAVLRNKAVCLLSLSRFEEALATHEQVREFCAQHGMAKLIAEADYNIAYLYFLRGDYLGAQELYESARREARKTKDAYHAALCDLDQAEMWIELNLTGDAAALAEKAARGFRKLGMGYERAKAQVFLALCAGRQGELERALSLLQRARKHFESEGNAVWPAMIDLQAALLLEHAGWPEKARQRARRALGFFSPTVLPARAIQCRLLLARTELQRGRVAPARVHVSAAERLLVFAQSPVLAGHTWWVAGSIAEASRDAAEAARLYQRAQEQFESLRERLPAEELRLAFFQDKNEAYEAQCRLLLEAGDVRGAFRTAERAKSRALAAALRPRVRKQSQTPDRGKERREHLHALYRQLEAMELRPSEENQKLGASLRAKIDRLETELRAAAVDGGWAEGQRTAIPEVEEVCAGLAEGSSLVEYYMSQGRFQAFVLGRSGVRAYALADEGEVRQELRYLQFQLARVRQAAAMGQRSSGSAQETQRHLENLYRLLLAPLEGGLGSGHCAFVPHGRLHGLPFHALFDGRRYFSEGRTTSVAPSSAIYCQAEAVRQGQGAVVFGVPDAAAPQIAAEAQEIAGMLPGAQLYLGEAANLAQLEAAGATARYVHLATHGKFRRDNPWFSSIQLGDGPLNLYDLYRLRLPVELVTLSGCSTGVSAILGGDELVGLVRGLLQAGAQSALLSLWDVSDTSTLVFMKFFYRKLAEGAGTAQALQEAQHQTRAEFPHPFYWAPFCLVGGRGAERKK